MKATHEAMIAKTVRTASSTIAEREAMDFARQAADETVDFAVIVALQKELHALQRYFPDLTRSIDPQTPNRTYYRTVVHTQRGGPYRVVVAVLNAMGNVEAAHATAD